LGKRAVYFTGTAPGTKVPPKQNAMSATEGAEFSAGIDVSQFEQTFHE